MKPIQLTPKEISRADREIPDRPFTIIVRPQSYEGGYWVAAIDLNTRLPLFGGEKELGQRFVDSKDSIPDAIREIGRDLHKFTGFDTKMTDKMRHQHMEGKPSGAKNPKRLLASSDQAVLLKLAASLPKGDESRRAILSGLKKTSYVNHVLFYATPKNKSVWDTLLKIVTKGGIYVKNERLDGPRELTPAEKRLAIKIVHQAMDSADAEAHKRPSDTAFEGGGLLKSLGISPAGNLGKWQHFFDRPAIG